MPTTLAAATIAEDADLRFFPWGPPVATTGTTYDYFDLTKRGGFSTIGDVEAWLRNELRVAGYADRKYWNVPGGFALVTQLESIDDTARPVDRDRFIEERTGGRSLIEYGWSPVDYLVALVSKPADRARVFLFIVTDDDKAEQSKIAMTTNYAKSWMKGGTHSLSGLKDLNPQSRLSKKHIFMILVYEFIKDGRKDPIMVEIGRGLRIENHLRASGLKITERLK